MEDHCIFCGKYIAEGRQFCTECEKKLTQKKDLNEPASTKKQKHKHKNNKILGNKKNKI